MTNIAVTGAGGYLGSQVSDYCRARGLTIFAVGRKPGDDPLRYIPFELGKPLSEEEFKHRNIEILIHCAYDFSVYDWSRIYQINVEGSRQLFEAAQKGGIQRIVYISSQSAYRGCRALFGRAKFEIEQLALSHGAAVIRPGLIYGKNPGSMVGSLVKSLSSHTVVPVIAHPGDSLHLIHQEDLCEMIYQLATQSDPIPSKPIVAASKKGWSLGNILQELARHTSRRVRTISVPWFLAWWGLALLEKFGLRLGFRSDSILTLGYPTPSPEFDAVRLPQFRIREFPEGL